MLQPGDTIRGYRVDALLGEGGMAWVYAATRETDGTRAALKILKSARPEGGRRVLREAAAQQDIHHRHVVQVYDVIEVDERPALVMERVNGPSLQQWLLDRRPSAEDALTVFRGVLAGVQIAHREGMVHRDLKPSNVLLSIDTDGLVPKVADFGLAKPSHRSDFSTQSGVMLGTRGYMAPEQIRDSKSVDLRADVFSPR